nr:hypothetical protein [Pseudomonas sp. UBA1879]
MSLYIAQRQQRQAYGPRKKSSNSDVPWRDQHGELQRLHEVRVRCPDQLRYSLAVARMAKPRLQMPRLHTMLVQQITRQPAHAFKQRL